MGCTESAAADGKNKKGARRSSAPPMTKTEIHKRIESIDETRRIKFGGVSVRYAYLSQRGYYPDDAHKPNQDSFAVIHDFAGRDTDAFFGVFDGHGRDGDKCAHFVRDNLGALLARGMAKLREESGEVESKEKLQGVLKKAHVECNRRMHTNQRVDDSLSGTTSISVYLHGARNRITISNVGDSRAVIGRVANPGEGKNGAGGGMPAAGGEGGGPSPPPSGTALKAFALSRDQTPYRRDERVRIRKTGARILSLDQIEGLEPIDEGEAARDEELLRNGQASGGDGEIILGEEIDEGGDPPRVWSPHGEYPGTAFTRSIGDAVAEELGVTAEPELLTRELTPEDRIIVLASDGVFEFLTNQSVVDICAKFADPLEACRAVVAESYELWLQYELRTDDITMICIFVDGVDGDRTMAKSLNSSIGASAESENQEEGGVDDDLIGNSYRPVRKNMSVEKSRHLMARKTTGSVRDVTDVEEEDFDIESLYNEKTEEQKESIAEAIQASVVFQNITDAQRELIYKVMEPMEVQAGQWIIKQGTVGDRFYIVDEGSFEVRILPEGQEDADGNGGNRVHVYEGSRKNHSHPSFGELALMYSAPRAASIVATTDGCLWALHRYAFKQITARPERAEAERVLKKIDIFRSFRGEELKDLSSYLCEAKFGRGDTIIKEGDVGDSLFIILPGGNCKCVQTLEDGTSKTTQMKGDDIFGEEVLKGGKYLSTVTATTKSTVWMLQKSDVKRVMKRGKSSKNMAA